MKRQYDAVLLIAFGGPERMEDVRPFLANVLRGVSVPPQRIETVVEQYRSIGGRSPLNEITLRQAQALEKKLRDPGSPLKVYVGMRNWTPSLKETLEKMKRDGVRRAAGIILAPQKSEASWDKYAKSLEEAQGEVAGSPQVDLCPPWHDHPLFIEAIAECVRGAGEEAGQSHWIFTAHSIPVAMDERSGYSVQVRETARLVAEKLGKEDWEVAYQSRTGRPEDPWLEPDIRDRMGALRDQGVRSVLAVPVSFVGDHVEVLYDLDVLAREAAEKNGMRFFRSRTVNDHPLFIEMLSSLVRDKIESAQGSGNGKGDPASSSLAVSASPNPRRSPVPQVAVVGGGITGLACALRLLQLRKEKGAAFELHLLESSEKLGGVISTVKKDGFLYEEGPDAIFTEKPWGVDFIRQLGLESKIVGTNPQFRKSFIALNGRLHSVPEGFYLIAPSRIWPLAATPIFSIPGKLRAVCDLWIPARHSAEDESLGSFVRRRLGREVLERMAQPMVGGIYSADPEELSLLATFPRFAEMEKRHGSVIRGLLAASARSKHAQAARGPRYSLFVTLSGGLSEMALEAQKRIPSGSVRLNARVRSIRRDPEGFRITCDTFETRADAVCVALPAFEAGRVLKGMDPDLAEDLGRIPYHDGATVHLAYKREDVPHPLDGFGFVVPDIEGKVMTGCTFSSVKFPGRTPPHRVILRLFTGGKPLERSGRLEDSELVRRLREELKEILQITAEPLDAHVSRYPAALPQYRVGHLDLIQRIGERLRGSPGLSLAGNAYSGVGLPDCIHCGEQAAEELFSVLEEGALKRV